MQGLVIQEVLVNKKYKIIVVFGSNRAGKTEVGSYIAIECCLKNPKARVWMCAETFADSVNIQQRKVYNLLPKNEMKYAHYDEVNGFRNRKIIFKNGSRVEFKSYDQKREGFQGDDLDLIVNDEEPSHEIVKEQRMRLIDRDGIMIFTMTPVNGMTELIGELYENHEVLRSEYAPLIKEDLPRMATKDDIKFFMLWSTENKHINQARLVSEAKYFTRPEIKARFYGIPSNMAGKIYPMYSKDIHVVRKDEIPKSQMCIWMGLDPHDSKPWAMQWWGFHKPTGRIYCLYEYPWKRNFNEMEFDDKTYVDYVKVIREIESDLIIDYGRSVSKRIIDPNFGNSTVRKATREGEQATTTLKMELKRLGLHFRDGIDGIEVGHLQVRKWLHYELKGKDFTVRPKAYINEECENTDRHLSRYAKKDASTPDGDVKDRPAIIEKYKDFCDCFPADVMITTNNGDKRISDLSLSDRVLTRQGYKNIVTVFNTGIKKTYKVSFSDGRTLIGSGNHPVYVQGKGFIDLITLRYGDVIVPCVQAKPVYVLKVTGDEDKEVYNLTVDECHEFFANGILVHNCTRYILMANPHYIERFVNYPVANNKKVY